MEDIELARCVVEADLGPFEEEDNGYELFLRIRVFLASRADRRVVRMK